MKIALFITCFNDTLFPNTGKAVVTILDRLGHQVAFPEEQTCCGQMHFNTGYQAEAMPLIKRFVRVFSEYECIVSPSASCVGMVREMYRYAAEVAVELIDDDTDWAPYLTVEDARKLDRVRELLRYERIGEALKYGSVFELQPVPST